MTMITTPLPPRRSCLCDDDVFVAVRCILMFRMCQCFELRGRGKEGRGRPETGRKTGKAPSTTRRQPTLYISNLGQCEDLLPLPVAGVFQVVRLSWEICRKFTDSSKLCQETRDLCVSIEGSVLQYNGEESVVLHFLDDMKRPPFNVCTERIILWAGKREGL